MYRVDYTLFGEEYSVKFGDLASVKAFAVDFLEWTIFQFHPLTESWIAILHSKKED